MSEFAPVIFVDLIEEKPKTFAQYSDRYRGFSDIEAKYREYREKFQPWRLMIKSADNQKKMFRSTERYFNQTDAIEAAQRGFGSGTTAFLRQAEHGNVELRRAVPDA